ncbi:MAG: hypothetical protein EOP88_10690 [Verrucomicrobiaceae bacterium]|nr:MAG: hypothetical protein EOP88_10690 [Verrucomicrobiaceae bacterium]
MKFPFHTIAVSLTASFLGLSSATAALSFGAGYGGTNYHTAGGGDGIISFDWGSDNALYYSTSTSSFTAGGVYRHDGLSTSTIMAGSSSLFAGASVVSIGGSIYFNDSTFSNVQRVHEYTIGSGTTTTATVTNYSLGTNGTDLFISGGDFSGTRLTWHPDGISGSTIDLGGVDGASGPLTFDASGNLYYAPGFGDLKIYSWSASEVAATMSGGTPLSATGNVWVDYTSAFSTAGGATSMTTDEFGNVIVTITNFTDPSALVKFSADGSGSYETIATSTDRLGEVRLHEGKIYLAEGSSIVEIIPEPSSFLLAFMACGAFVMKRRRG